MHFPLLVLPSPNRHCVLHMENPASPSFKQDLDLFILYGGGEGGASGLMRWFADGINSHGSVFAVQAGWEKSSMSMLSTSE
ncbi:uncharacterized protein HKW66_Vig0213140 [Vigna angularis]|uniref:Uncharacterized protein n=1 Tax=Phaseolus angularis TaxID=3914 RepID=A0A8T0JG11_PHAAN|nr:uncharacterized protein HKW66_Vig0213140 [Vigna angularis]